MHKPVYFLLCLGLLSQLFYACNKDDVKVVPDPVPAATLRSGYFVISSEPNGSVSTGIATSEFDLGPLFASEEFMFMVDNGGDEPIFDVSLTSSNTPFEISPRNIQLVPGKKENANVPLLTVGITHGMRLKVFGSSLPLPKGDNRATITLTGKTLSGKDTIEVSGTFIVKVDAKVSDAQLLSGDVEAKEGLNFYGSPALIVEPSKTVKIVNTGNVPIQVSISYMKEDLWEGEIRGDVFYVNNKFDLLPDQVKDITNLVSPIAGRAMEGNVKFLYEGMTNISLTSLEPAVLKTMEFSLQSK